MCNPMMIVCFLLVTSVMGIRAVYPNFQSDTILLLQQQISGEKSESVSYTFDVMLKQIFAGQPTIVASIVGLQGIKPKQKTQIQIYLSMASKDSFRIIVKVGGIFLKVKVCYLAFQPQEFKIFGLLYWEPSIQSIDKTTSINTIKVHEIKKIENSLISQSYDSQQYLIDAPMNSLVQKVNIFLKKLILKEGQMSLHIDSQNKDNSVNIEIKVDSQEIGKQLYFVFIQLLRGDGSKFRVNLQQIKYNYYQTSFLNIKDSSNEIALAERSEVILFHGVTPVEIAKKPKIQNNIQREQTSPQMHRKQYPTLKYVQILIFNVQSFKEDFKGRLLQTCPSGEVHSDWDWSLLGVVNDTSLLLPTNNDFACRPCPVGCLQCQYVTGAGSCWNADCTSCFNAYNLKTLVETGCPNRKYCACKNSNFPQLSVQNCRSCTALIKSCKTCAASIWASTYCAQCNTGFYFDPTLNLPRQCLSCPITCALCTSSTVCSSCASPFILVNGMCSCDNLLNLFYDPVNNICTSCSNVILNCLVCEGLGLETICSCVNGQYFNTITNTCVPCNTYCLSCSNTTCTSCQNTFNISGMDCICNQSLQVFLNTNANPNICQACASLINNCSTCGHSNNTGSYLQCLGCDAGFVVYNYTCLECSNWCVVCNIDGNCVECIYGYYLTNGSCVNTTTNCSSDCVLCDNSGCLNCSSGFTLSNGSCVNDSIITNCSSDCVLCDNSGCLNCSSGFTLSNGSCVNDSIITNCSSDCVLCDNSGCLNCSSGFTLSNGSCVNDSIITNCSSDCVLCDNSGCLNCSSGFTLSNGSCVNDSIITNCSSDCVLCDNSGCLNCSSGFTLSNGSCVNDSIITNCSSDCVLCDNSGCLNCSSGFTLSNGSCVNDSIITNCSSDCVLCDNSGCLNCSSGFTLSNGSCVNDSIITNCSSDCVLCDNSGCLNCSSGFTLSNGSCVNDSIITNCSSDCVLCDNSGCLNCSSGFTLSNGSCVNDSIITNCSSDCVLCDNSGCLNCSSGFTLSNGSCVNDSIITNCSSDCVLCDNSGCLNCSSGFTLSNGSCVNDSIITNCSSDCVLCDNSGCLNCSSGFTLSNGSCVNDSIITNCSSDCVLCDNSGCLNCSSGFTLSNGSCVNDSIITNCSSDCVLCDNSGCLNCSSGFTLSNGSCVNDSIITNCSSDCVLCDNSGCLNCSSGFTLSNGSCVNDSIITNCSSDCVLCDNSGCLNCSSGFTLSNGSCVNDSIITNCSSDCVLCDNSGCLNCSSGFTLSNGSCVNDSIITNCSSDCVLCDNSGCLNCSSGFTLSNGSCVNDSIITNCSSDCVLCDNSGCLNCSSGFTLSNGSCVNDSIITNCSSDCVLCDNSGCLNCSSGFTLSNGSCVNDSIITNCSSDCVLCDNSGCLNCSSNFVLTNQSCTLCNFLNINCLTCIDSSQHIQCIICAQSYSLVNGYCQACQIGCLTCQSNMSCSSCVPGYTFDPIGLICTNTAGCNSTEYFVNNSCLACPLTCSSCTNQITCISCQPQFYLVSGSCVCNQAQGFFTSPQNNLCNQCGIFNSTIYGVYTLNCLTCFIGTSTNTSGFECQICNSGYYVQNGRCSSCQLSCLQCTSLSVCSSCMYPMYILSNSSCICNQNQQYFNNGTTCQLCSISNCSICLNLTQCLICDVGYFTNYSYLCELEICGNSIIEGSQICDDGNNMSGDGCNNLCQVEQHFLCQYSTSLGKSTCHHYDIQLFSQIYECNTLQFQFKISGMEVQCQSINFLTSHNLSAYLEQQNFNGNTFTSKFILNKTVQAETVKFEFNMTSLCVSIIHNPEIISFTASVYPTNNVPAIYYEGNTCQKQKKIQSLVSFIEYGSYGILILSALPCKIVGLQLFGVLQLAFLSLGSIDNINLMQSPLKNLKGSNGLNLDIGQDSTSRLLQTFTSQRISAIDYKANFIRNCNLMLIVVISIIVIGFILYLIAYFFKHCIPCLFRVAQRIIKEVVLTLILFNGLNFAYSAGIHFRYAPYQDSLYVLGTIAAVLTIIVPILMAIALLCSEEQGFGQYKDKLKKGPLQKSYFVITIAYRIVLGLYLSSGNEDDLSTLIVLAISLFFLLYNLVNLPFTKAYHNYRANICHLTQFVILFVAMYYRSMMSTTSTQVTAFIFGPIYFQYSCIVLSMVVSLIVLIIQIYIFIKECCKDKDSEKDSQQNQRKMDIINYNNIIHESTQSLELHQQRIIFQNQSCSEDSINFSYKEGKLKETINDLKKKDISEEPLKITSFSKRNHGTKMVVHQVEGRQNSGQNVHHIQQKELNSKNQKDPLDQQIQQQVILHQQTTLYKMNESSIKGGDEVSSFMTSFVLFSPSEIKKGFETNEGQKIVQCKQIPLEDIKTHSLQESLVQVILSEEQSQNAEARLQKDNKCYTSSKNGPGQQIPFNFKKQVNICLQQQSIKPEEGNGLMEEEQKGCPSSNRQSEYEYGLQSVNQRVKVETKLPQIHSLKADQFQNTSEIEQSYELQVSETLQYFDTIDK